MIKPARNGLFLPKCCGILRVENAKSPNGYRRDSIRCLNIMCLLNDKPETYIEHRLVILAYACFK